MALLWLASPLLAGTLALAGSGGAGTAITYTSTTAWSTINVAPHVVLSNSNLTATGTTAEGPVAGNGSATSTKRYYEVLVPTIDAQSIGVCALGFPFDNSHWVGSNTGSGGSKLSIGELPTGTVYSGGSSAGTALSYTTNDIVMVAVDPGAGTIWFGKNGTWDGSPGVSGGFSIPKGILVMPCASFNTSNASGTIKVGGSLTYAPPSGFTSF